MKNLCLPLPQLFVRVPWSISLLKKADIYVERDVTGVKPHLTKRSCGRMVQT